MQIQKSTLALLVLLLALSTAGLILFYYEGISGGESRGHGAQAVAGTQGNGLLWLLIFVIALVGATGLIVFKTLFPDIKANQIVAPTVSLPKKTGGESALQAILRVLNADEKKVIETLAAAQGSMLQKDIRWKTGLTRVKTHRILARLSERDIIRIEKHYNTNKVTLTDWITKNETT